MKQRRSRVRARSALFFLAGTAVILLSCVVAVFYQIQQRQSIHAADLSYTGAPTIPAGTVDQILARAGSPMVGVGTVVEQAAQKNGIDDAFALAVWMVETSDGAAGVGYTALNPGGVRSSSGYPVGPGGYTLYASYADGVRDWFNVVKTRYADRGLTSIYELCGPYVGTSSAYSWAAKVTNLMLLYREEVPPPAAQVVQQVSADAQMVQHVQKWQKVVPHPTVAPKVVHTAAPATVQAPTSQKQSQDAMSYQPFLLGMVLLVAVGIALSSLQIGKRKVVVAQEVAERRSSEPVMPLPALYVNQYSPILEREPETGPQIPIVVEFAPAFAVLPLRSPSFASPDYHRAQPLRLPSQGVASMRNMGVINSRDQQRPEPVRGGLLKRYGTTENLEPKPAPVEVPASSSKSNYQPQPQSTRITEDLSYSQFADVSRQQTVPQRTVTEDLLFSQFMAVSQQVDRRGDVTEDVSYSQFTAVTRSQSEEERRTVPVGVAPRSGSVLRRPRRLVSLPTESF